MAQVDWNIVSSLADEHDTQPCFIAWLIEFTDTILRAFLIAMIDQQVRRYEILKDSLRREVSRYDKLSNVIEAENNQLNSYLDSDFYRIFRLLPLEGLQECVEGMEFFDTFDTGSGRVAPEARASRGSIFECAEDMREKRNELTFRAAQVTRASNWTNTVIATIDAQLEQLAKHRGLLVELG